jgi:hypothetical protein
MTHLCLVSDQPVPNLLPALDPTLRPERVVLAVSTEMHNQARWLELALKRHSIPTEYLPLDSAIDLPDLSKRFLDYLCAHAGIDLALNVTGGTKPMAIAAQEAFRMAERPVFYVSVQSDQIYWLDPAMEPVPLTKGPGLATFLLAHGYQATIPDARRLPDAWHAVADRLAQEAGNWGKAIGRLNAIAKVAEERRSLDARRIDTDESGPWDDMLRALSDGGVIDYYDDRTVRFPNEEARFFANGGWLEHYVYRTLRTLPEIKDVSMNVTVKDETGNRNELDTAFLHRNRLFLVECKTRIFDERGANAPASNAVYKLDALKRLGGLRTHGILISYRKLRPEHRRRADADGIQVLDGASLSRLREVLKLA